MRVRCANCSVSFEAERPTRRYCSDRCRQAAYRDRAIEPAPRAQGKKTREQLNTALQKKLDAAVKAEVNRLHGEFHKQVDEAVAKATEEQRAELKRLWKEASEDREMARATRASVDQYMTEEEYKLVLNCLHPDRAPEDRRERFAKAFAIVKRLEVYVNRNLPASVLRERGWNK